MEVALPQDEGFNANNNSYNRYAYENLCNEFKVSSNTKWTAHDINHGMGQIYIYSYFTNADTSYEEYKGPYKEPNYQLTFEKIVGNKWIK